jgi:hypothetical protein
MWVIRAPHTRGLIAMPDPQLEEFCRIGSLQDYRPDVFRRHQRHMRDVVQPRLDERDQLIEENAALTEEVATLKKSRKATTSTAAVPA